MNRNRKRSLQNSDFLIHRRLGKHHRSMVECCLTAQQQIPDAENALQVVLRGDDRRATSSRDQAGPDGRNWLIR